MTATPPARIDRLRIERGDNAFSNLTPEQRLRLIVQVLCGLVAYDDQPAPAQEAPAQEQQPTATDLTDRLAS